MNKLQTVKAAADTIANVALQTAGYAAILVVAITVEEKVHHLVKK